MNNILEQHIHIIPRHVYTYIYIIDMHVLILCVSFALGVIPSAFQPTGLQCNLLFATVQVADEVVVDRISGRRIDPLSGKIYHVKDLLLQCLYMELASPPEKTG